MNPIMVDMLARVFSWCGIHASYRSNMPSWGHRLIADAMRFHRLRHAAFCDAESKNSLRRFFRHCVERDALVGWTSRLAEGDAYWVGPLDLAPGSASLSQKTLRALFDSKPPEVSDGLYAEISELCARYAETAADEPVGDDLADAAYATYVVVLARTVRGILAPHDGAG